MSQRRPSEAVRVGELTIGGGGPVVLQSMTTTRPEQRAASLTQIRALHAAGCQLVRIAVPSLRSARALAALKQALVAEGLPVALVADVHFQPSLAVEAAAHVEKVRINPGNFAPGLEAARARLAPLLEVLRERGAALRIGVNHGSLAPYIVDRHGHGVAAMVASALDYVRLCHETGFRAVVVSLKASDPTTMIAANRQFVAQAAEEGCAAPIHLGVTEAGEGWTGALRSAVGIGTLLREGIGDTIRVSLTGDPAREIPVCRAILGAIAPSGAALPAVRPPRDPLGDDVASPRTTPAPGIALLLPVAADPETWPAASPLITSVALCMPAEEPSGGAAHLAGHLAAMRERWPQARCWLERPAADPARWAAAAAAEASGPTPRPKPAPPVAPIMPNDPWLAALTVGVALLEREIDQIAVQLEPPPRAGDRSAIPALDGEIPDALELAGELLQVTGRRRSHAEFVSCPGCGRLHYDLASAVRRLRRRFGHLRDVKFAVMGCAVNGPGEMADADYGCVGGARQRVDLYAAGRPVRRGLTPEAAEEALVEILQADGHWVDPPPPAERPGARS